MLGNEEKQENAVQYLSIHSGKISQKATENNPNAKLWVSPAGEKYWKIFHDFVVGYITQVSAKSVEHNGQKWQTLEIYLIDDDGDLYRLQINFDTDYARSFMNRMWNIDLAKAVKLKPYDFQDKTDPKKRIQGINILQGETKVERFWENSEVPSWEKHSIDNKTVWDKSKQREFYLQEIDKLNEAMPKAPVQPKSENEAALFDQPTPTPTATTDEGGLPF